MGPVLRHQFTDFDREKATSAAARRRRRDTFQARREERKEGVRILYVDHDMRPAYIAQYLGYSESTIKTYLAELKREGRLPSARPVDGKVCQRCRRLRPWQDFYSRGGQRARCIDCRKEIRWKDRPSGTGRRTSTSYESV